MSASALLMLALLGVAGSLLVAGWLWRPPAWLWRFARPLKIRASPSAPIPFVPPPDDPVDRTIYETYEELGVEDERVSPAASNLRVEFASECLPLESVFPTAAGDRTEYLPVDPEWSASEP
jgi:hypothetical protein